MADVTITQINTANNITSPAGTEILVVDDGATTKGILNSVLRDYIRANGGAITTASAKAASSAGLSLQTSAAAACLLLGAGGSVNATAYGGWNFDAATADRIASFNGSKTLTALDTATYPSLTELSYVKGVTSALQTQLNARAVLTNNNFTARQDISSGSQSASIPNTLAGCQIALPSATTTFNFHGAIGWSEGSADASAVNTAIGAYDAGAGGAQGFWVATGNNTTLAEALRVDSSQNVGIGQTSPGSRLDVKGTLRLSGSSSGYVGLAPAAAAGSTTYTLPSADGTSGQVLSTNGSGTLSWSAVAAGGGTLGTPQNTTSGTAITFSSLPSGIKKIVVSFDGVSLGSAGSLAIQIGDSGGLETSGYNSSASFITSAVGTSNETTDYILTSSLSTGDAIYGAVTLSLLNSSTNLWALSGTLCAPSSTATFVCAGSKALSAVLDRIAITTTAGTATFDAGSVNILYFS